MYWGWSLGVSFINWFFSLGPFMNGLVILGFLFVFALVMAVIQYFLSYEKKSDE